METITGEGLQNLGLCARQSRPLRKNGSLTYHTCRNMGHRFFPVSSEGPPYLIASYNSQGDAEELFLPRSSRVPIQSPLTTRKGMLRNYSYPDPHGSPFSRLLRHTRGWGDSNLTWALN
jgi:hypothetical protein